MNDIGENASDAHHVMSEIAEGLWEDLDVLNLDRRARGGRHSAVVPTHLLTESALQLVELLANHLGTEG